MPKSTLTWYKTKANKILRILKGEKQQDLADLLNVTRQTISYRMKEVYPVQFGDFIQLLDKAGYEIVEKGEGND